MKQCVYHLHIPRTSGVLIREVFKNQKPNLNIVSGHTNKILLSDFESANFISGHYGTLPIKYSDKTFSIIREPIERTFSYLKYIWSRFYYDMSIQDLIGIYISDSDLSNSISNQQSKFLTGPIEIKEYNRKIGNLKEMVEINWSIKASPESVMDVLSFIDKNNIEILDYKSDNLYSDISKIVGTEYNKSFFVDKVNSSPFMTKAMHLEYYDKVAQLNMLDLELYELLKS